MSYSRDTQLFWELLDLSDAELMVDNDMCIITYNFTYNDDEDQESESQAFEKETGGKLRKPPTINLNWSEK
jgi:hypothetical protein